MKRIFIFISSRNLLISAIVLAVALVGMGLYIWGWQTGRLGSLAAAEITNRATATFQDASGQAQSIRSNRVATVLTSPTPNSVTVDIKANSSDGPVQITAHDSVELSWTAQNALSCSASGDWQGDKPTSGQESASDLSSDRVYTLTCVNEQKNSADSVIIIVISEEPAPTPESPPAEEPTSPETPAPTDENQISEPSTYVPAVTEENNLVKAAPKTMVSEWRFWTLFSFILLMIANVIYQLIKRRRTKPSSPPLPNDQVFS